MNCRFNVLEHVGKILRRVLRDEEIAKRAQH